MDFCGELKKYVVIAEEIGKGDSAPDGRSFEFEELEERCLFPPRRERVILCSVLAELLLGRLGDLVRMESAHEEGRIFGGVCERIGHDERRQEMCGVKISGRPISELLHSVRVAAISGKL